MLLPKWLKRPKKEVVTIRCLLRSIPFFFIYSARITIEEAALKRDDASLKLLLFVTTKRVDKMFTFFSFDLSAVALAI